MENKILIYDIETKTYGRPNPTKDKIVVFGCYSYITNKYYYLTNLEDIKTIIEKHKFLVGFNNIQYDNMVIYNNGLKDIININKYGDARVKYKINIDLMQIIKQRASAMKIKEGMLGDLLMSYSLDYITKLLGLVDDNSGKIKDFDYDILNKESLNDEDKKYIIDYLKRDLDVTKKLYEWLENYFEGFKYFVNEKDIENKNYLTSSISVFTYKAICKELGIEEEYDNNIEHESYGGGYVSYPAGEEFEGDIYALDYNSLYPHIFAQCNLFSPSNEGWNGNNFFKVKGIYNDKILGEIEKLLMKFYKLRLEYKKNKDPREYSVKIIINTSYGIVGNPSFKHLYNPVGASDCTRLGRQWTLLARRLFREAGFEILYTDTDSVYIKIKPDEKQKMLEVKNNIIKTIKDNIPFPCDTFDMGIDDEISHMWFFKGKGDMKEESNEDFTYDDDDFVNKHLGLMKKNYIYLTKDGRVVYKNLGVKKKSTSQLTRHIFREILIPKIKEDKVVKWERSFFEQIIKKLLEDDLYLAATRYKVNEFSTYKNPSQLQAQIAKQYGSGVHNLIKNKKIGVGIGSRYCSVDEFKQNGLKIEDIDLSNVWSELGYFIKEEKEISLEDWGL